MANEKKQTFNLKTLETTLEKPFGKQAPQLPKPIIKAIVDYGPYLIALGVLVSIPGIIAALGFSFSFYPYYRMGRYSSLGMISTVISLIAYGFSLAALPGLFKKTLKAWRLLFYSSLIVLVGKVIELNLVSLVVTAVINWYLLFQIKSSYK